MSKYTIILIDDQRINVKSYDYNGNLIWCTTEDNRRMGCGVKFVREIINNNNK